MTIVERSTITTQGLYPTQTASTARRRSMQDSPMIQGSESVHNFSKLQDNAGRRRQSLQSPLRESNILSPKEQPRMDIRDIYNPRVDTTEGSWNDFVECVKTVKRELYKCRKENNFQPRKK